MSEGGYPVHTLSPLEYAFTTRYVVTYRVVFKPSGYLFGEVSWADSCYEVLIRSVEGANPETTPSDALVVATIVDILSHFFENRVRVVVYTCETADGRGAARARKFDGWFRKFNDDRFVKADRQLFDPRLNLTYQNSILLRADHPQRDEVLAAFEALFGGLEAGK
jgi:hypothetical protein